MAGISECSVYIPLWRIKRDEIAKSVGLQSLGGERSVAFWDEDVITMGVEASRGIRRIEEVSALVFATTSSPFRVKQCASLTATALDLPSDVFTVDVTDSFRAGTSALSIACNMVDSGKFDSVLVVTSEKIPVKPATIYEQILGDGAVALLVERDGKAEVGLFKTHTKTQPGAWMRVGDESLNDFDMRVSARYGFAQSIQSSIMGLISESGINPAEISDVVISAPDPRSYYGVLKSAGIKGGELFFDSVGIVGTAHPFLMLADRLGGEGKILLGSYGDGSDAFLIDVKDKIKTNLKKMIESKKEIDYGEFLHVRGKVGEKSYPDKPSPVKYWRDEKSILRFYGMKCRKCGVVSYPISRCCVECGAKDDYEEVKLSERGEIYTYTIDNLISPGNYDADGIHPHVVAVVDFEGGGRAFMEVTDLYRAKEKIEIGMGVERTFRLLNEKNGFRYYYWKVRLPR